MSKKIVSIFVDEGQTWEDLNPFDDDGEEYGFLKLDVASVEQRIESLQITLPLTYFNEFLNAFADLYQKAHSKDKRYHQLLIDGAQKIAKSPYCGVFEAGQVVDVKV